MRQMFSREMFTLQSDTFYADSRYTMFLFVSERIRVAILCDYSVFLRDI